MQGFFFLQEQAVKRDTKQKRNAESLQRIGCAACSLNKAKVHSPKMPPTLAEDTLIYFLGEAPGPEEDKLGAPFVGKSGRFLRACIPNSLIDHCSFDNVIRDYPGKNKDGDFNHPEFSQINCCRGHVTKSIEQAKPKLIVGLGIPAQEWVLGSADQIGMRGRVFAVKIGNHSCWFMPTYHPSRVNRAAGEQAKKQGRDPFNISHAELLRTISGRTFKFDLDKAFKLAKSLEPPIIETEADIRKRILTFDRNEDFDQLLALLAKAKAAPYKAIDIETDRLRPYGKPRGILSIGISYNNTNFSFSVDHRSSHWTKGQRDRILAIVADIISDNTIKIAHNCFAGETEIITDEGIQQLKDLAGKEVKVWTEQGWHRGSVRNFGKQNLKKITVVPYNRSRCMLSHDIHATDNHNWVIERLTWFKELKRYKFSRVDGFIKTKDLKKGDKIVAAAPTRGADTYSKAFIHGLIFADGALIKAKSKPGHFAHQIRLCGWKSEFSNRFEKITYPKSAEGDPICNWYVDTINLKELPPKGSSSEYIQDFIEGWQLLDGTSPPCKVPTRIVTTLNKEAAEWLCKNAALSGWLVTGSHEKDGTGFTGKPIKMYDITLTKDPSMGWTVRGVSSTNRTEDVYCASIPLTSTFTLGPGIYTGNCPFEIEWFIHYFGKEIVRHEVWECSQLQAHFIDERRGAGQSNDDNKRATYLSLNFLVKQHFGVPFKQWFDVDRKNMAQADLAEILVYNGADTLFTLPLWGKQNAQLRASGLYEAYKVALPRQATCALTQYLGMDVNQAKVKELQGKLKEQIAVLEAEIEGVDVVQQYIKDKPIKYKDKEPFNPMGQDAIVIFRDYLKRQEIQINDGKKIRWSVDKHILEKIDHPLARLIVSLRNKIKMKSTYIDGLELGKGKDIWPDGKIHCNFNATFTTTGRFSSDFPNMQNWPHRTDPWTREQIVAPDGHVIVAADYGQLEACAAAMISRDKTFIRYLWDDFDTHASWAIKIAKKINKDISNPKVAEAFRSEVKGGFVFASFYGATARKVASTLGIEEHLAEEFQEELWETFSGYRSWQLRTLKHYREKGYVETPTGRRRHHPLTSNELLNSPIQGFASDIVVDAMDQLSYMASTENKWHLHPRLNVHDDLTTVVPEKKLVSSIETIYKTMLTPSIIDLIPKEYQVPLSVTVSIGKDWFHMEKIQKFYSHKDV